MRRSFASLVLLACVFAAQAQTGLVQQQETARKQQEQLRERIEQIEQQINRSQADRRDAADQLRQSETAISDINRRLNELQQRQAQTQDQLKQAEAQQVEQLAVLEVRRSELAQLLRGQYASGLSPWAALLSGDDPQDIARELQYLGYVNRSQAKAVQAVDQTLEHLARLRKAIKDNQKVLAELENQVSEQKQQLLAQKAKREKVLASIDSQLKQQRSQAQQLEQNDKRLGALIGQLDAAIAEQRERARLQAEQRKAERARLAREKAEQARAQAQRLEDAQVENARVQRAQARQQEQQKQAAQEISPQAVAAAPSRAEPAGGFQGLTKGLPYPVRTTEVLGRFGAQRPDGGLWRGIVMRAAEGTPVKAIAGGRVVYASWLAGFGNILIVDHGQKYLSVYAYNQALLRRVGDIVAAGDTVAAVGATGGQLESGLYFELRHEGAPVNPLLWLK